MDDASLKARFDFAQGLIAEAAALAQSYFARLGTLTVRSKGVQDMASEADLDTEVLIRDRLKARFPEDDFFGEETGSDTLSGAPGLWVVDPIDGTQPFVSGMTSWCVSIAFVLDGVATMGFVTAPERGEIFVGWRGHPATLNGQPITVSPSRSIAQGIVAIGHSPRVPAAIFLPVFGRLIEEGAMFYRDGSGALSLCYVACGRLIGYVEAHINSWDCLAAVAIIEAAGGRVNDVLAGDGLRSGNRIVAGPPALYPALEAAFGDPA
jgi:myo-inositol-1(or 4)-monophosphatase